MTGRGWRTSAVLREAWQGVASYPVRSSLLLVLVAVVCGGVATLELRESRSALRLHRDLVAAGANVAIVTPEEGATLDVARCAALAHRPHVRAAGAIGSPEPASFARAPGLLVQGADVSPGLLRVFDPGLRAPASAAPRAVIVGAALAGELGLAPGMALGPAGEPRATIVAVADTERRYSRGARWAFHLRAPVGVAEECWVEFTAGASGPGIGTLPGALAPQRGQAFARSLHTEGEFTRDASVEFAGRPQRFAWPVPALLVAGAFWLVTWFRRSELGLYMALGTPRLTLIAMGAAEAWTLIGGGFLLGFVYAAAAEAALGHAPGWPEVGLALRLSALTALLALALVPLAHVFVRGNILGMLKER